jgi:hypothetical protein
MPFPLFGMLGGLLATRAGFALTSGSALKTFARGPIIQGGQFGVGYTGGSYLGYGSTNTADPFGLHKPKYRHSQQSLGLSYGYSRYSRYSRYRSRYGRRRSYYRRRPAYYRRYTRRSYY